MHHIRKKLWTAKGMERAAQGLRSAVELMRTEAHNELAQLLVETEMPLAQSVRIITEYHQKKENQGCHPSSTRQ